MDTTNILEWSDRFHSGHPAMDRTHEDFIRVVNDLAHCADADVPGVLAALAEHCSEHFADERRLMELHEFPSTECHIAEHEAVLGSVREVMGLTDPGLRAAVARRLSDHLAGWFEIHLTHLDSAVAHWVMKRTHGGIPVVVRRSARRCASPMPASAEPHATAHASV